jgi:pimeloyl-ACP methyl ester carboxylesterase
LQKSRLVELDGVGHVATQSTPGQVAEAVQQFCEEPSARA